MTITNHDGKLHDMRSEYEAGALDETTASPLPFRQFARWLDEAIQHGIPDPNAMVLSTVSPAGMPSSRVVLLKEYTDVGFVFFTNYLSRKGVEIAHQPFGCLNFWWGPQNRQIRINGRIEKASEPESDTYFLSRPIGSQVGAIVSPQSQVIPSREWLEDAYGSRQAAGELVRPDHWGGYVLIPNAFEFWQGRTNRLHDRLAYDATPDGAWHMSRLAP